MCVSFALHSATVNDVHEITPFYGFISLLLILSHTRESWRIGAVVYVNCNSFETMKRKNSWQKHVSCHFIRTRCWRRFPFPSTFGAWCALSDARVSVFEWDRNETKWSGLGGRCNVPVFSVFLFTFRFACAFFLLLLQPIQTNRHECGKLSANHSFFLNMFFPSLLLFFRRD